MKSILVTLKCITNLHVGNGDVNYNIIDNEVERDAVTGYPTINSSGVKGALRSYFKTNQPQVVESWFGSDPKEKTKHQQGSLTILSANMLAIPLRASAGEKAFHLVYTEEMLNQYKTLCSAFNISTEITADKSSDQQVTIEGFNADKPIIISKEKMYLSTEANLKKVSLPVIARNYLENGKSSNLWYEEVVPHESVFYFVVASENENAVSNFAKAVNDKIIQFGGNASIGYGLCKVTVREGNA